jgi:hypothetical protein
MGASMRRREQIEVLLKRSSECEILAEVARDVSIRRKCAELAAEYRILADRMRSSEPLEEGLS